MDFPRIGRWPLERSWRRQSPPTWRRPVPGDWANSTWLALAHLVSRSREAETPAEPRWVAATPGSRRKQETPSPKDRPPARHIARAGLPAPWLFASHVAPAQFEPLPWK